MTTEDSAVLLHVSTLPKLERVTLLCTRSDMNKPPTPPDALAQTQAGLQVAT